MSSVVIAGDTSGTITISAPAVAGTPTLTLPTTTGTILTTTGGVTPGTAGNILTSNGTAWTSTAPAASGPVLKIVTDTTDISVTALPSAGYSTIGSTFSVSIPTTGCIAIRNLVMKITNNQANYGSPVLGLRIGSTNYWLSAPSYAGVTNYEGAIIAASSTLNYVTINYNGVMGTSASSGQYAFNHLIDIVASGIPTGTQTVQLIVGKSSSFSSNFTIGGTTVTTRVGIEFVSAS
jgi:hypothetical protein